MLMATVHSHNMGIDEADIKSIQKVSSFMTSTGTANNHHIWFLDSGCSNHMCGDKSKFINMEEGVFHSVKLGNDTRMKVGGKGQVKLIINHITYVINDTYYIPELKNNLLSIGQLQERGLTFVIKNGVCKIFHDEKGLMCESLMTSNRMFPLYEESLHDEKRVIDEDGKDRRKEGVIFKSLYSDEGDLSKLWHDRYGHISATSMGIIQQKQMVKGLPQFTIKDSVCVDCCVGKQTRKSVPKTSQWRANSKLELVHSDVCGPIKPATRSGKRYLLSFIDDYSRKGWVYLIKEKSEVFECFKAFKTKVETETGNNVKALRTDTGGEYLSNEFKDFCIAHGIRRQLTTSFTPQQNGVAERKNRTVMNMVVTLMAAKNMPKIFWGEAAVWSYFILNRCSTKALTDVTPYEAWHGEKPNVKDLRVWGCIAHAHIPKEKRSKLDDKSKCCVLVGRSEESKAYRLIDPKTMKVVISKDVLFEEDKGWDWEQKEESDELMWENDAIEADHEDNEATVTETNESSNIQVREGRQRRRPGYLDDYITGAEVDDQLNVTHLISEPTAPYTFDEAMQRDEWRTAMNMEMQSIEKNNTWVLVDLPRDTKCIGVKWIYKVKLN